MNATDIISATAEHTLYDLGKLSSDDYSERHVKHESGAVEIAECDWEFTYNLDTAVTNDRGEIGVEMRLEIIDAEDPRQRDVMSTANYPEAWGVIEKFIPRSEWPREIAGSTGDTPDTKLRELIDKYKAEFAS